MQESIQLVIDSLPFLLKGLGIPCNSVSAACFLAYYSGLFSR